MEGNSWVWKTGSNLELGTLPSSIILILTFELKIKSYLLEDLGADGEDLIG